MIYQICILAIYGIMAYLARMVFDMANGNSLGQSVASSLRSLPGPLLIILLAIPEQIVLSMYEPSIPIMNRILVSVAMYAIYFGWNKFGAAMRPKRAYIELVWILGTAIYAYRVLGVRKETACALIAADSVMTLTVRGLGL